MEYVKDTWMWKTQGTQGSYLNTNIYTLLHYKMSSQETFVTKHWVGHNEG